MRLISTCALAVLTSLLMLSDASAQQTSSEPEGFGKLHWGMSEDQMRQLYPDAKLVDPGPPTTPPPPFVMNKYTLASQKVGPFKSCQVDFQFFNKRFYQYYVSCPDDKSKIEAYLTKEFGQPTVSKPPVLEWTHAKTHTSYTSASGVFLVEDLPTSQQVSIALLAYVLSGGGQQPQPEEPHMPGEKPMQAPAPAAQP